MATLNVERGEIHCKVVYYGPGSVGKTTNLVYLHTTLQATKSELYRSRHNTEHELFFESIFSKSSKSCEIKLHFHLFTIPGSVIYPQSWRRVLRGVDGIVHVVSSRPEYEELNLTDANDLWEHVAHPPVSLGRRIRQLFQKKQPESPPLTPTTLSFVLQHNQRDLPNALPLEQLIMH